MKTPREIAHYTFGKMHSRAAEACENEILAHIESAIETDRAQRDIYELIAEALDERADDGMHLYDDERGGRCRSAAEALRDISNEVRVDDAWDNHIGPMLDAMEEEYGR